MKLFENGESVNALLELHYKQMDLVYPAIMLFEAVISHGVVARVIWTSVPEKAPAQVSPYEQSIIQPAICVNVKKSVNENVTPVPPWIYGV